MKRNRAAWWFVAPALGVIAVFFALPVLAALVVSFADFDIYALADIGNLRFVGLRNYVRLLETPLFWQALGNTFYFVAVGVPLSIAASLAAALLLNSPLAWAKGFFRTALFVPVVTTLVAVAVIWRYLLSTRYGLINYVLGRLGIDPVDWLGDPHWAMPAIILFAVWKSFGYNMVILFAGLQGIPRDYVEAAEVFGAGFFQRVRHVIFPMLKPSIQVALLLRLIFAFEVFAVVIALTGAGAHVLASEAYIWQTTNENEHVAAAYSMVILGLSLAAAAVVLVALRTPRERRLR